MGWGTLCSSERSNVTRFCTDIVDNWSFKPWNIEMCSFLVNVATYTTNSFIFDRSMTSVNYQRIRFYSFDIVGRVPLKIDALMAKMAIPPAMTRPPSPKDPRGSFGGPLPPAPRCLIISRKLKWAQNNEIQYPSMGLREDMMIRGRSRRQKGKKRGKDQRGVQKPIFTSPHTISIWTAL